MSVIEDTRKVLLRTRKIYERRRLAVYALSLNYAAQALRLFQERQSGDLYWNNQTKQAYQRMFANAEMTEKVVSWFMAHGVDYGIYLELANNRAHEAIRPIINELYPRFREDLERLYGVR
jgi:hypothetical protein